MIFSIASKTSFESTIAHSLFFLVMIVTKSYLVSMREIFLLSHHHHHDESNIEKSQKISGCFIAKFKI